MNGMEVQKKLSLAYWPNPEANESAHQEAGDKVVDSMTLGELKAFFDVCTAGPTYCMVRRRFAEQLRHHFQSAFQEAASQAKQAIGRYNDEVRRAMDALED